IVDIKKSISLLVSSQVEDETSPSAVYVNVEQLRQSISESTSSCSPSYLDLTGWEVHVDQESGQEYYYHPTGNPLPPSPPLSPAFSPSPASPTPVWSSDWEQLVDETSGRPYFYNPMSGETTWEPPEQLSPYPPLMEPMSVHRFHEDGPVRTTRLGVIISVDDRGHTYYYLRDGSRSLWNLPEVNRFVHLQNKNKKKMVLPFCMKKIWNLEKAGILNKTKVSENGKKVRKNWTQTWTVLHGGVLTFHKDPKSTATGYYLRSPQIVPEVTVDLKGATICWATKDKSSKKNVLELKTKNAVEFLIQYDTESIIVDWHRVLTDTIRQLVRSLAAVTCTTRSAAPTRLGTTGLEAAPISVDLMKFLMKRPTLQSVKEKGYIRDNVFGCHLATLCAQEKTTVPRFVEKCIKAVEKRGLDIDGLYRVSGNLAVIQKLRYKADHEELDLEDGQWEDVHVITGALKLFFRELPEPLFPFGHFNKFVAAIRNPDYNKKLSCIYELVKSLPSANHDTMKLLFGHLRRVIQYGDDNRMTVQNVAIVFGPTLLRPEMESQNIAMHMVFQNQIVEFILNEYDRLFYSS
uniref:Rho GTPase activating protein 27 n=1 Tax=Takifugu rubripes TaxID=31033 RepID=A0A674N260_TAKRU